MTTIYASIGTHRKTLTYKPITFTVVCAYFCLVFLSFTQQIYLFYNNIFLGILKLLFTNKYYTVEQSLNPYKKVELKY